MPSFLRRTVVPGDLVYPLRLFRTRLYVLTRIQVGRIDEEEHDCGTHTGQHPDPWHLLCRTCASEIVTAAGALSVRFDVEVPYQILERWAYISPRGERGLKNLRDGGLHSSFSVQGIYQLRQETAAEPGTERTSERCR
jgi:hypothetical protein